MSLILLTGLQTLPAEASYPWDNIPSDKIQHFGIAGAAQTLCSGFGMAVSRRKWTSTITCFVLINGAAAAKEAVDPYVGHQREVKDIYANLAGSGLSFTAFSIAF